jgi:hypothetical protein
VPATPAGAAFGGDDVLQLGLGLRLEARLYAVEGDERGKILFLEQVVDGALASIIISVKLLQEQRQSLLAWAELYAVTGGSGCDGHIASGHEKAASTRAPLLVE